MNEILQQRIEEAAYQYIQSDAVAPENMQLAFGDFINGAKWALQNQWISVEEALPPVRIKSEFDNQKWSDWVLIRTHKGGAFIDSYVFHKHTWTNNGDDVTHWMMIPEMKGGE